MERSKSPTSGYILVGALGATAGGIAVAVITRAVPAMISRIMSGMMENMMAGLAGEGCDPEEM